MILGIKRSGESLKTGGQLHDVWTPAGRARTVEELRVVQKYVTSDNPRGARGALVVVGAGNGGFRGAELVKTQGMDPLAADQIGLTGTILNSLVIHGDLQQARVPHRLLLASGIEYRMPGMDRLPVATPEAIHACVAAGEVAVIGGGSGTPGQSTDSGILDHVQAYTQRYGEPAEVYKGTTFDGVYDKDPARQWPADEPPRLLSRVSASVMRDRGWFAVDPTCLDLIEETGMQVRVHNLEACLSDVVAGGIGTLVVPQPDVLEYA